MAKVTCLISLKAFLSDLNILTFFFPPQVLEKIVSVMPLTTSPNFSVSAIYMLSNVPNHHISSLFLFCLIFFLNLISCFLFYYKQQEETRPHFSNLLENLSSIQFITYKFCLSHNYKIKFY